MDGRVRFKASRPVYRRGGLLLSSASWVIAQAAELDLDQVLALVEDPVVSIEAEGQEMPDTWHRVAAAERQAIAEKIRDARAEGPADAPSQQHTEAPPSTGGVVKAEGSNTPASDDGEGAPPLPADDSKPVENPPVEEVTPKPVETPPAKTAKTGGKGTGTKPSPAKKSDPEQPAPAPKAAG